ncbi:MAG TPA: hypothetical protein VMT30_09155 [Candidatus Saccharimonadia bacterium]|nr:hypothetical protein [Candidatus Saccharimonadia bacterium]
MADEPNTPAPVVEADATIPATPDTDPTPTQTDSKSFTKQIDSEIDDLLAQMEGRAPKTLMGEDAAPDPPSTEEKPAPAKADVPKAEALKADTPAPTTPDTAEIERAAEDRARARIADEQRVQQEADRRIRDEQQFKAQTAAYVGSDDDYGAVEQAVWQHLQGDSSALNGLDVVLPNGKKVSEVKGSAGLTEDEAANLMTAWKTARRFEDVMGDRKVQRIVDLWNHEITSSRVLADPDVDQAAVTQHTQPHDQMRALRDTVRDRVTKRLTTEHAEVVKAKDAEIKRQADRIDSLVNERGNLTANRRAADAATVDRPGQPGARPTVPTPEELAAMPFEQAFKSGAIDRVLQSIPGGLQAPRRRAG